MDSLYSRLAEAWDRLFPPDFERIEFLTRIAERVSKRARIAEVGCGSGATSRALAERGFAVSASDLDPGMIAAARSGTAGPGDAFFSDGPFPPAGEVRFRTEDMVDALRNLLPESAHVVLCLGNTLPYAESAERADEFFAAAAASLVSGGILVLQMMNYPKIVAEGGRILPEISFGELVFRRRYTIGGDPKMVLFETEVASGGRLERRVHRHLGLDETTVREMAAKAGLERIGIYGDWNGDSFDGDSLWYVDTYVRR